MSSHRSTYDADGNPTASEDLLRAAAKARFSYDTLGRLRSAHGSFGSRNYSYDPLGNLTDIGAGAAIRYPDVHRAHPHAPRASGKEQFEYTLAGTMKRMFVADLNGQPVPGSEVGFTRLGNLLGLLDREEVPEVQKHSVWVGKRIAENQYFAREALCSARFIPTIVFDFLSVEGVPSGKISNSIGSRFF